MFARSAKGHLAPIVSLAYRSTAPQTGMQASHKPTFLASAAEPSCPGNFD
jgi:hypothetical protein